MRTDPQTNLINPASGAIIMSIGIFLYAAIDAFPLLNKVFGPFFVVLLIVITFVIYIPLNIQFFHKYFLFPLLKNPVNSFVMGTWIAGVSVLCNVILKYFPGLSIIVFPIAMINTILWLPFLVSCVRNFFQLIKQPTSYSSHGIILLSTVATQSLVIIWVNILPSIPRSLVLLMIVIGLLFYLCGLSLIAIRYFKNTKWSLQNDWTNTNCIIHGALSITGLALVSSHSMPVTVIINFWLIVFTFLLIVEVLEVIRGIKRVQQLGWCEGIFTYDISQWSRNFTFGMFYAFTIAIHDNFNYSPILSNFHKYFLSFWAWVVLVMLIIEIYLFVQSKFNMSEA